MKTFKFLLLFCLLNTTEVLCQNSVLKNTYNGNVFYLNEYYKDAVKSYEKALDESPFNFDALYNLGNTFFRLESYDKALDQFQSIVDKGKTKILNANVYHNIGNCFLLNKDLESAIESYKESLKLNPKAEDTRYNLAFALKLQQEQKKKEKENQKQNNKDEGENDEKNTQEKSKETNDKDDEPENEKPKETGKENEQPENDESDKNDAQPKPEPNKLSPEQAKRLLEAAARKEQEIQKKKDEKSKIGTGKPTGKKDW